MYICPIMVAIIHRHVIKLFLLDFCLSKCMLMKVVIYEHVFFVLGSLLLTVTHAQFILPVPRWRVHALFCISVCRFGFRTPYILFDKCPVLFIVWMLLVYLLLGYFFMIISFNTFVLPILLGVFGQNYFNAMHGCYSEC